MSCGPFFKEESFFFKTFLAPHLPRARRLDGPPTLARSPSSRARIRRGSGRGSVALPAPGRARGAVGEQRVLEGRGEARRDDGDMEFALVGVVDDLFLMFLCFFRRLFFFRRGISSRHRKAPMRKRATRGFRRTHLIEKRRRENSRKRKPLSPRRR